MVVYLADLMVENLDDNSAEQMVARLAASTELCLVARSADRWAVLMVDWMVPKKAGHLAEQKAAQSDLHWVELMVALKVVQWASHWAAKLVGYSAEQKAY